jgi:hypothetical protein
MISLINCPCCYAPACEYFAAEPNAIAKFTCGSFVFVTDAGVHKLDDECQWGDEPF